MSTYSSFEIGLNCLVCPVSRARTAVQRPKCWERLWDRKPSVCVCAIFQFILCMCMYNHTTVYNSNLCLFIYMSACVCVRVSFCVRYVRMCVCVWLNVWLRVWLHVCVKSASTRHMCWRHVEIGCFLACFDLSALFDLKLFWVFAVERLMSFWTMRWHLVPGVAVLWTFSVITWLSVRLFVILVFCLTTRHRWTLQYASTCCMPMHPDAPASSFNQPDNSLLSSELDMKAGQLAHFWHTWQTCTLCGRHCTPLQVVEED